MRLIKLPLKLLALPVILVLLFVSLLGNIAVELSSYIWGPLMLFVFGCGISSAVQKDWNDVLLLCGIEAAGLLLVFAAAWLIGTADVLRGRLTGFLHF